MTTVMAFHEVDDGDVWANAWRNKAGSRHEMFAKIGVECRTFRDPDNTEWVGVILEVPDMKKFRTFMESPEAKRAMDEDGLRLDTMRILTEFTP